MNVTSAMFYGKSSSDSIILCGGGAYLYKE